mmetsp:Transcript_2874/g.6780  ORF Transcript_2874/g.6780 Transcript_2874/m.6780 type:complete len:460 (-) Transcript_2874:1195-2574(-)
MKKTFHLAFSFAERTGGSLNDFVCVYANVHLVIVLDRELVVSVATFGIHKQGVVGDTRVRKGSSLGARSFQRQVIGIVVTVGKLVHVGSVPSTGRRSSKIYVLDVELLQAGKNGRLLGLSLSLLHSVVHKEEEAKHTKNNTKENSEANSGLAVRMLFGDLDIIHRSAGSHGLFWCCRRLRVHKRWNTVDGLGGGSTGGSSHVNIVQNGTGLSINGHKEHVGVGGVFSSITGSVHASVGVSVNDDVTLVVDGNSSAAGDVVRLGTSELSQPKYVSGFFIDFGNPDIVTSLVNHFDVALCHNGVLHDASNYKDRFFGVIDVTIHGIGIGRNCSRILFGHGCPLCRPDRLEGGDANLSQKGHERFLSNPLVFIPGLHSGTELEPSIAVEILGSLGIGGHISLGSSHNIKGVGLAMGFVALSKVVAHTPDEIIRWGSLSEIVLVIVDHTLVTVVLDERPISKF